MSFAEECLERAVSTRALRIAILKDDAAFERLYARLQQAMTRAWSDQMREGIAASLDKLRDLGPGEFTKADAKSIMATLERSVGVDAIRAAMRDPVIKLTDALFREGAGEVGKAVGIDIAFNRPDLDALDILQTGNLYWIGDSWNVQTQDKLAAVLDEYFREGMTREDLTRRFVDDFSTVTGKSEIYWEMLADHTATKTREMGRVTGYDRAQIDMVQVRAQIDSKTTAICRAMHGRVIPVSQLRDQRSTYLDAMSRRDYEGAKTSWTMHGDADGLESVSTGNLPRGTSGPPYHFRCRTITVMFRNSDATRIDRVRAIASNRERVPRDELRQIAEDVKRATWPSTASMKSHARRHIKDTRTGSAEGYAAQTRDIIDGGWTDIHLAVRKGAVRAVLSRPDTTPNGREMVSVVVVDLETNTILTHHNKKRLRSTGDEVQAVDQKAGGIKDGD